MRGLEFSPQKHSSLYVTILSVNGAKSMVFIALSQAKTDKKLKQIEPFLDGAAIGRDEQNAGDGVQSSSFSLLVAGKTNLKVEL